MTDSFDFIVIGSGLGGLLCSLKLAGEGRRVALITKRSLADGSTSQAQGGIAAVTAPDDSIEEHVRDTMNAGAGLCHEGAVRIVAEEGPRIVRELVERGVQFTLFKNDSDETEAYDLGLEGGHSHRRILHAHDSTGREIQRALMEHIHQNPNISVFEHQVAIDLITGKKLGLPGESGCLGVYVLDRLNGRVRTFTASATILATGGAGKVYRYTTNPDVASGDGLAMAYRAGARLANLEFVQFHPTCLFHPQAKSFLISEAMRGEGGILKTADGTVFMQRYHPRAELAPRDVVARAIDQELKERGEDCVYLDMTHRGEVFLKSRFPAIYDKCLQFGIDIAKTPIPVVPAAHYFCGGVATNEWGETNIPRLYAVGEVACTGLHGANRLASNSLLECAVFADRAAHKALTDRSPLPLMSVPDWDSGSAKGSDEQVVISQNWDEVRRLMWNYVGIVRSDKRLSRALRRIRLLQQEIQEYYWNFQVTSDLLELRNIALVAELVISCAQARKESRGLHYNIDFPRESLAYQKDTVIQGPHAPEVAEPIFQDLPNPKSGVIPRP
jgi:L-aspartate oxidase